MQQDVRWWLFTFVPIGHGYGYNEYVISVYRIPGQTNSGWISVNSGTVGIIENFPSLQNYWNIEEEK